MTAPNNRSSESRSEGTRTRVVQPPRYKLTALTWLALYPMLTLVLTLTEPLLRTWPLPLRTLVVTAVLVPAMTYGAMPLVQRLFAGWLAQPRRRAHSLPSRDGRR